MRNILLTIIWVITVCSTRAQQKPAPGKFAFSSVQQVALINGDGAISAGLQSVNGIKWNQWFAGIGVGLDFYRYRTVPLFIDVKRTFPLKKNALFVYADVGYSLPWLKDQNEHRDWPWGYYNREYDYKGRLYLDGGVGFDIKLNSAHALLLSAGYSYKAFDELITTTTLSNVGTPTEMKTMEVQKNAYRFNRLMLKVGWKF